MTFLFSHSSVTWPLIGAAIFIALAVIVAVQFGVFSDSAPESDDGDKS